MKKTRIYALSDVFMFGKYKGLSIQTVLLQNPRYIAWCIKNVAGFMITQEAWMYATSIDAAFIHLMPAEYRKSDELVERRLENGIELLAHYPWKDKQEVRKRFMNYARFVAEDISDISYCSDTSCLLMTWQLKLQFT